MRRGFPLWNRPRIHLRFDDSIDSLSTTAQMDTPRLEGRQIAHSESMLGNNTDAFFSPVDQAPSGTIKAKPEGREFLSQFKINYSMSHEQSRWRLEEYGLVIYLWWAIKRNSVVCVVEGTSGGIPDTHIGRYPMSGTEIFI